MTYVLFSLCNDLSHRDHNVHEALLIDYRNQNTGKPLE